jgi:hypothetical protein
MLSSTMIFNKLIYLTFPLLILFSLHGCTLIRMGQEAGQKIKTSTTYGYQNSEKPETIRNVKDYIVDENDFVIIAEDPYKTLYKVRNESNLGKFSMLSDLVNYCEDIEGKVQFGKQFGASIAREFDSIDFEFSSLKDDYRKNQLRGFKGWMKCIDSNDDFEINRKRESKYFLITHKEKQLQGYSLRWYIDYFDLEGLDINTLNLGVWSYSALVQLSGLCLYHGGEVTLSNRYTDNKKVDLDTYFITQLDPLSASKGYLLASGNLTCKNSDKETNNFSFDIDYVEKYRKLVYKRELSQNK